MASKTLFQAAIRARRSFTKRASRAVRALSSKTRHQILRIQTRENSHGLAFACNWNARVPAGFSILPIVSSSNMVAPGTPEVRRLNSASKGVIAPSTSSSLNDKAPVNSLPSSGVRPDS